MPTKREKMKVQVDGAKFHLDTTADYLKRGRCKDARRDLRTARVLLKEARKNAERRPGVVLPRLEVRAEKLAVKMQRACVIRSATTKKKRANARRR